MKKIIYLFCLICTITLAKGQYYRPDRGFLPGINAGYFYPTGDMGKILKNGIDVFLKGRRGCCRWRSSCGCKIFGCHFRIRIGFQSPLPAHA